MGTAFTDFPQYGIGHYPGQVEDYGMADIVSRVADSSAIGYGVAVIEIDRRSARLPTGAEVSHGITVRESVQDNPAGDNPTPEYEQDHEMSVMRVGRINVTTVDGAAFDDNVYVVPDTGELTNTDNAGTNIQLPNAAFKSAAAAGEIALVQLDGNQ